MNKLKTGQNYNNKLNSFCQDLVNSQLWKEFISKIKHFWEKSGALVYCLEEHKDFKLKGSEFEHFFDLPRDEFWTENLISGCTLPLLFLEL